MLFVTPYRWKVCFDSIVNTSKIYSIEYHEGRGFLIKTHLPPSIRVLIRSCFWETRSDLWCTDISLGFREVFYCLLLYSSKFDHKIGMQGPQKQMNDEDNRVGRVARLWWGFHLQHWMLVVAPPRPPIHRQVWYEEWVKTHLHHMWLSFFLLNSL